MEVWGRKTFEELDNCHCKPCEGRNVSTRAKGFCGECEEYMCNACFDTHKTWKLNRGHTLINSNEQAKQKVQAVDLEKCDQHLKETIKFFCSTHEQFGCGDCMVLYHNSCKIEYIQDMARTFKDSREFKEMVKWAEKSHTEAKKLLSSVKNNKVQVVDINEKFNQDVNKLKDEIMSHVTKMANTMLRQGRDVMEMDIERMNTLEKDIEGMINELSLLTEEFESQIDRPNKLFVSSVLQKPKLKRLREQLDNIKGNKNIEIYEFKCDDNLERLVEECKQFGHLQRIKQRSDKDYREEDDVEEQQEEEEQKNEEEVRPKEKQQIVQHAVPTKLQPLLDRQMLCRNITVDGEYLSYAENRNGIVGLYVDKNRMHHGSYYEVEILSLGIRGTIAIGLVPESYPDNLQPGCGAGSIGYHADDGRLYYESGAGKKFGPKCKVGDRIGCGLIAKRMTLRYVVFTRNGKKIGEKKLSSNMCLSYLYAAVGMHSNGENVRVLLDAKMQSVYYM